MSGGDYDVRLIEGPPAILAFMGERKKVGIEKCDLERIGFRFRYFAAYDPHCRSAADSSGVFNTNGAFQHCLLPQFDVFPHPVELPGTARTCCRTNQSG